MSRSFAFIVLSLISATSESAAQRSIPAPAKQLIASVRQAALTGNPETLRSVMADDFTSSFGGDGGIQEAITIWRNYPAQLSELAKVTAQHCQFEPPDYVECPADAGTNYRAGFKLVKGEWLFSYFVTGD